jgi:hypothetical protein
MALVVQGGATVADRAGGTKTLVLNRPVITRSISDHKVAVDPRLAVSRAADLKGSRRRIMGVNAMGRT